jgi:hypothetical protein
VLSVLLRYTNSDYPYGTFKLFLLQCFQICNCLVDTKRWFSMFNLMLQWIQSQIELSFASFASMNKTPRVSVWIIALFLGLFYHHSRLLLRISHSVNDALPGYNVKYYHSRFVNSNQITITTVIEPPSTFAQIPCAMIMTIIIIDSVFCRKLHQTVVYQGVTCAIVMC